MLNYEEELAKFQPSKEIEELDICVNDKYMKDAADVLLEVLQEKEKRQR